MGGGGTGAAASGGGMLIVGESVSVAGLQARPELNGTRGTIVGFDVAKGR